MDTTVSELLTFVQENDVKFIRLSFCDLLGAQKHISIMADGLEDAFKHGVTFDAHAVRGFQEVQQSDLLLFPEPGTIMILPWRPGSGRVAQFYCEIRNPDGSVFAKDSRSLVKRITKRAASLGYVCKVGAECEFYLFKTDEDGEATKMPLDRGGYLDIAPLDRGEDIRREICLTLDEMGLKPETSHHEQGPGQNEVDFMFGDALTTADNLQTFKTAVKAIAARNGLFASFMPKPLLEAPGSGLHVNLSLSQNGTNIFQNPKSGEHSKEAESFIAGILAKITEITAFLNPLTNSYERFGKFEAPKYVSWSHQNRSQLIRIPAAEGERVRMELRSPDPSVNPYLAFALILAAGLDGIDAGLALPPSVDVDLYTADNHILDTLRPLPESLEQAVAIASESEFVKDTIGEEFLKTYLELKHAEIVAFNKVDNKAEFYESRYFHVT